MKVDNANIVYLHFSKSFDTISNDHLLETGNEKLYYFIKKY